MLFCRLVKKFRGILNILVDASVGCTLVDILEQKVVLFRCCVSKKSTIDAKAQALVLHEGRHLIFELSLAMLIALFVHRELQSQLHQSLGADGEGKAVDVVATVLKSASA